MPETYQISPNLLAFLKTQPARTILAADDLQNAVVTDVVTARPPDGQDSPSISILFDHDASGTFELYVADSQITDTAQLTAH